jgi:hypothetical protein
MWQSRPAWNPLNLVTLCEALYIYHRVFFFSSSRVTVTDSSRLVMGCDMPSIFWTVVVNVDIS